MTSNAGIEYINLKKAKYNRSMREAASENDSRISEREVYVSGGEAAVKKQSSVPLGREYGARDFASDVADELIGAYTKSRREAAKRKASSPVYVKKYVKEKKALPISLIAYIVIFSALLMFLVMGNTKINEATLRADALKSEIAEETAQAAILDSSLSQRNDVTYIEDYAVNVLGMVKSTDVSKKYVSISGEDKVVVGSSVNY